MDELFFMEIGKSRVCARAQAQRKLNCVLRVWSKKLSVEVIKIVTVSITLNKNFIAKKVYKIPQKVIKFKEIKQYSRENVKAIKD